MANKEFKKASVLAFEKKLVPSDGYMYGTTWDDPQKETPIHLVEKSVRGTISNRVTGAKAAKLDADIKNANPQTVDNAALSLYQDTLVLRFTLKVLPGVQHPSACDSPSETEGIQTMVENFIQEDGFKELAKRYALNLANGRFLWRNRVGAEKVEITVHARDESKDFHFNGYDFPLNSFDTDNQDVLELAGLMADALSGKKPYLFLEIQARALVGKGQDVYPSEEMVLDKVKGDKSKVLYAVDGIAAMHSQKLGNAIRTIDTWYPAAEDNHGRPIAVEPYGSVTNLGRAYRPPKEKKDFYTLFDKWVQGVEPETEDDRNYVMAVLIRGGVFGDSKEK